MATLPMAVCGLEIPAGDVAIPARTEIPAAFRITMAAIDPSAEPEDAGTSSSAKPRATLKLIRQPLLSDILDDDDSDFDEDEMNALLADGEDDDSEESSDDDEEINGGPSDPAKSKKARKAAAVEALKVALAEEMELDEVAEANGTLKGKGKALELVDEDEDDEDDDEDSDEDSLDEPEEFVICTLDPEKTYQQPLDITIGDDERVFFKVSGNYTIYLTGNYVEPMDAGSDDYDSEDSEDYDSDEYDLSPDEDELELDLDEDDLSEDDLDDLDDPRITELDDEEEEAPALVAPKKGKDAKAAKEVKGKNKRPADDSEGEATLDDLISKAQQTNGEAKLSKKQAKKLKNNAGQAVAATEKEEPSSTKGDKKVSFAEKLEQGPTPSPSAAGKDKASSAAANGPKVVQGVTIDVKREGEGDAAKKGDRVGMRYIGKLKDGKVFDSNKKGKPFTFKLGVGEVIKGWDIGVAGMRVGGERRITVPAHLAYGSKKLPDIPANSTLIFDVKLLEIKKN